MNMNLKNQETSFILSDELIELVVGGITIDGKEISDEKFQEVIRKMKFKSQIVPIVQGCCRIVKRNSDGMTISFTMFRENEKSDFKLSFGEVYNSDHAWVCNVDCQSVPEDIQMLVSKVNDTVKSFESRFEFRGLEDIPSYTPDTANYIPVKGVLELEGINFGEDINVEF